VRLQADAPLSDKVNCLWQGTSVVSGAGNAVVVNTAATLFLDKWHTASAKTQATAFERDIKHFGYFLMQITIVLSIIILSVNIYFKSPYSIPYYSPWQ